MLKYIQSDIYDEGVLFCSNIKTVVKRFLVIFLRVFQINDFPSTHHNLKKKINLCAILEEFRVKSLYEAFIIQESIFSTII